MITDKITFKALKNAPSPKEVDYWIDTATDPNGGTIKYNNGKEWAQLNSKGDDNTSTDEQVFNPHRKITAKYLITEELVGTEVMLFNNLVGLDPTAITKARINGKWIDPSTVSFYKYVFDTAGEYIVEVEVSETCTLSAALASVTSLKEADLSNFKVLEDTHFPLASLFYGATNVEKICMRNIEINCSAQVNLNAIFLDTSSLRELDMTGIVFKNFNDTTELCWNSTFINSGITEFNFGKIFKDAIMPKVFYMIGSVFSNCTNLKKFIINDTVFESFKTSYPILNGCNKLEEILFKNNKIYSGTINDILGGNSSSVDNLKLVDLSGTEFYGVNLNSTFAYIGKNIDTPILNVKLSGTKFINCSGGAWFYDSKIKNINFDSVYASSCSAPSILSNSTLPRSITINGDAYGLLYYGSFTGSKNIETVVLKNVANHIPWSGLIRYSTITHVEFQNIHSIDLCDQFTLTSLETISFNGVSKIERLDSAFADSALTKIDFTSVDLSTCYKMNKAFSKCTQLTEVKMSGPLSPYLNVTDMFSGVTTTGTFYYDGNYDYSKIIAVLPETWTAVDTSAQ